MSYLGLFVKSELKEERKAKDLVWLVLPPASDTLKKNLTPSDQLLWPPCSMEAWVSAWGKGYFLFYLCIICLAKLRPEFIL